MRQLLSLPIYLYSSAGQYNLEFFVARFKCWWAHQK
jgi:hypothetical protein